VASTEEIVEAAIEATVEAVTEVIEMAIAVRGLREIESHGTGTAGRGRRKRSGLFARPGAVTGNARRTPTRSARIRGTPTCGRTSGRRPTMRASR
jgi:hypothetical protein